MNEFVPDDLRPETLEADIDGHAIRIETIPRLGANLASFQVDGREFIFFDPALVVSDEMGGAFHMFPTPCRLAGCRYTFQGHEIRQRKHGEEVFIHGLIQDEVLACTRGERSLTCILDITPDHHVYQGFPFPGRFSVSYKLRPRGLDVSISFLNAGERPAPVGYGLHPYWHLPDSDEVLLKLPADYTMDLADLIPTGKLTSVAGTEHDWRQFRSLKGTTMDAVFYPRLPDQAAGLAFPGEGIRLTMEASANMKHLICYASPDTPFVCVENLTCSPNAPNLFASGFEEVSGLVAVAPGHSWGCWIRYTVENM